jgi:hypothetical protein
LADRLLPAFETPTKIPYPRVNLRHGVPFYPKSIFNAGGGEAPVKPTSKHQETTETCSAGAGSLTLEFTTLSRLTGDPKFERLAKRAFWAVWERRSSIGLIGAGIDAEDGNWIGLFAGIGAGTDSFFEYAFKTYVLTSGLDVANTSTSGASRIQNLPASAAVQNHLTAWENAPERFLEVWKQAHGAIKRHIYSEAHHPHYLNVHLSTGSVQAMWIDSLGAYYPGLLALAGEVEEAVTTNLLYTALWTRYSALPERWSVRDGGVEQGLSWWPLRPELAESNYYLYRATRDPWYLYVGEMLLKDIQRRCWAKCGWSGLQDVRTGQQSDRMESFFLGETVKYLYLLFDFEHPLNSLDAPFIFSTEGHPLIIPRKAQHSTAAGSAVRSSSMPAYAGYQVTETCPVPLPPVPLTVSRNAARPDLFHAASLVDLHLVPDAHLSSSNASIVVHGSSSQNGRSQNATENYTFYPWTLPKQVIPTDGVCTTLPTLPTFILEFPHTQQFGQHLNAPFGLQSVVRVQDQGVMIISLSGLRLSMIKEDHSPILGGSGGFVDTSWRIYMVGNVPLGRDERVFIERSVVNQFIDPSFTVIRNAVEMDVILQLGVVRPPPLDANASASASVDVASFSGSLSELQNSEDNVVVEDSLHAAQRPLEKSPSMALLSAFFQQVTSAVLDPLATLQPTVSDEIPITYNYSALMAILPSGPGATAFPSVEEAPAFRSLTGKPLAWQKAYYVGEACEGTISDDIVKSHNILIIKRGGCTFSQKLESIPMLGMTGLRKSALKLVVMVSEDDDDAGFIRPYLDTEQRTRSGLRRFNEIPMIMIGGGEETIKNLMRAKSIGIRRRYFVRSQEGLIIRNLVVV